MIKLKDIMEEVLNEKQENLIDQIYIEYPAYMKDIENLLKVIENKKNIHHSMSREILAQLILKKFS